MEVGNAVESDVREKGPPKEFAGHMQRYANLSGNSGVVRYRLGEDWIDVQFVNGDRYRYDSGSVGKQRLAKMKQLAVRGQGLATYISRYVHDRYRSKLSQD